MTHRDAPVRIAATARRIRNRRAVGVLLLMGVRESEVIQRAKSDPAEFGRLYDRYVDRIYNYVYHRVGDAVEAEDLTSRTFYRSLVALPTYDDRGVPFSAWLYRIAHNVVANWHRDRARRAAVPLDGVPAQAELPGDRLMARTLATQRLRRAVRELDDDRQMLLILKFSQGLSNPEIAEIMGRSEGAVKSLYHRTLVALRDSLADGVTAADLDDLGPGSYAREDGRF